MLDSPATLYLHSERPAPPGSSPESAEPPTCDLLRAQGTGTEAKEALTRFVYRSTPFLLGTVFSGVCDHTIRDDLLQQTWLEMWRKLEKFNPAQYAEPGADSADYERIALRWVGSIATNVLHSHFRRTRTRRENPGGMDGIEELPDHRSPAVDVDITDELARPWATLEELDPRAPLIYQLRFFQGMTHDEIAARVGMSCEAVRQIYSRTLRELRECFPHNEEYA
jgi:RNA polymerase sigma factor (sigma-70 family)